MTETRHPYYRPDGAYVEQMVPGSTLDNLRYERVAVIDPNLLAEGTPEEIAEAVAEVLDLANLARDRGRYTAEAGYFHTAVNAPGFRWLEDDERSAA